MSSPKQLTKRRKLEKKRLRKRETRLKRQKRGRDGGEAYYDVPLFPSLARLFGGSRRSNGGFKMSDALQDVAAEEIDSTRNQDQFEQALSIAQTAWNIAIAPHWQHDSLIDDALDEHLDNPTPSIRERYRQRLSVLVARKRQLYPECLRPILEFRVDELDDGGYYLSVISGLVQ